MLTFNLIPRITWLSLVPLLIAAAPLGAQDPAFTLERPQITIGAESTQSDTFSTEETLVTAGSAPTVQGSDSYAVTNPIRNANNGLAIGSATPTGNRMALDWSAGRPVPADIQGFDIYRQPIAPAGDPVPMSPGGAYVKINGAPVPTTSYTDCDLANGTYEYLIYLVDAAGRVVLWSYPFQDTIAVETLPVVWVDFAWSGAEDGTEPLPHNTFDEGVQWVLEGGTVCIHAGTCDKTGTLSKPMRIEAVGGSVTIGTQ